VPKRSPTRHHRPGCERLRQASEEAARIGALFRLRFRLPDHHPVSVEQIAAVDPGFPPWETCVAFWTGNSTQHQCRFFKPAGEVMLDDLPPWWMKDALILDEFPYCDCCG